MCSDFHFLSNRKSRRPDFRKCVQILIFQIANLETHTFQKKFKCIRKYIHTWENLDRYVCLDLRFKKMKIWTHLRKSGRLDLRFDRKWKSERTEILRVSTPEVETPNNFKCVQIFIFYQIANLNVQIFVSVFRFSFFSNRKSRQVCIDLRTHLRKFWQVWVSKFAFWRK